MNKMNFISHDKLLYGFASREKLHKLVESTALSLSSATAMSTLLHHIRKTLREFLLAHIEE